MYRRGKLTKFQAQAVYQGKTRGLVIGNYVVLDSIGRGGMGHVYKARHRRMDRVVALKMLPDAFTVDAETQILRNLEKDIEAARFEGLGVDVFPGQAALESPHAVRVGDLLFCSGQIPLDPATGQIVAGDIKAQTERVLENVKAILADQKLTFANVVKATVFLTNLADFAAMNEVYAQYFTGQPPARSTVQVTALPRGARVGTCSTRRSAQLLALRPDLDLLPLRGNVDTRVRKALDGTPAITHH